MPAFTVGFPEFLARLSAVRARINRLRMLDAFLTVAATSLAAMTAAKAAPHILEPPAMRWLLGSASLVVSAVGLYTAGNLYRQWLDLEGTAVYVDRRAGLDARTATMLAHPPTDSRSPLRPILLWEIFEQSARWEPHRIAPMRVRRPAVICATALVAFALASVFAPEQPTAPESAAAPSPHESETNATTQYAALPSRESNTGNSATGFPKRDTSSSGGTARPATSDSGPDGAPGDAGGDRGDASAGPGQQLDRHSGGGSTDADPHGAGAGRPAVSGAGDLDSSQSGEAGAGRSDQEADPAAGIRPDPMPQPDEGASSLRERSPGSPDEQRDRATSDPAQFASVQPAPHQDAPQTESDADVESAEQPSGKSDAPNTGGAKAAGGDPTRPDGTDRSGILGAPGALEGIEGEASPSMVVRLRAPSTSVMEPQFAESAQTAGGAELSETAEREPAPMTSSQMDDAFLHRAAIGPLHQALMRELFTPPTQ